MFVCMYVCVSICVCMYVRIDVSRVELLHGGRGRECAPPRPAPPHKGNNIHHPHAFFSLSLSLVAATTNTTSFLPPKPLCTATHFFALLLTLLHIYCCLFGVFSPDTVDLQRFIIVVRRGWMDGWMDGWSRRYALPSLLHSHTSRLPSFSSPTDINVFKTIQCLSSRRSPS